MNLNELTYKINGAIFEVSRNLGPGFLEKVYENALMIELKDRNLKAVNQFPIAVTYKNHTIGDYIADIFVEDKVIVELETVEKLSKVHEAQLLNYLKATGIHIGLLVNFQNKKAEIRRLVYDLPEGHDD